MVEVTFNTAHKKGKQRKAITITSNDSENKNVQVHVSAIVEVEFDFDTRGINFGSVRLDSAISKTTYIVVKNPQSTQIENLETSSPFLTAEVMTPSMGDEASKIEVKITLLPGYAIGKINETVTAYSNLESFPKAILRISGSVQGDIEITPDNIRFDRYQSNNEKLTKVVRLQVINRASTPLHVVSVTDPDERLNLDLKALQDGQRFEITATLKEEVLGKGTYFKGTINIATNNAEQPMIKADYIIYNRQ